MRLNENTKIIGQKVILVPYEAKHVEKYHHWMQSTELQELTASEPLTLNEEYEMQRSWRTDEDKCTFLILCRETFDQTGGNEIEALIGDTNIFLHGVHNGTEHTIAEAEIMIAELSARGKGYGKEAMLLMLKYAQRHLAIKKFVAKIGMDNIKSLNMFKRFQFEEVARADVFREITLEVSVTERWVQWLDSQISWELTTY